METISLNFSSLELTLLCLLLVFFSHQLFHYLVYINGVLNWRRKVKHNKIAFKEEKEPLSVIICAKDELSNLKEFLPLVLEQDYPNYEVIVINDGSIDETENYLKSLSVEYRHLHTTFIPLGVKNMSTKKLAITLGVKASQYDWLVFTDADCKPESDQWLSNIARNFTAGTDFVLGYGAYFETKGFLNHLITFDTLYIALQYMGMALRKKPYMGVGRNMAYKKDVFYAQKGFATNLQLVSGDDDLMVNKAAKKTNCRIEAAPESVTWSNPHTSFNNWLFQKTRHLSVSSHYSTLSKTRLVLEPLSRAGFYVSTISLLIFGNLLCTVAALLLFGIRYGVQLSVINKSSKYFGQRRYIASLLALDIVLPLITLYIMVFGNNTGRSNYRGSWK